MKKAVVGCLRMLQRWRNWWAERPAMTRAANRVQMWFALAFPVWAIIMLVLAASLLSGCAPDPRKEAAAQATLIQAQQNVADQAARRAAEEAKAKLEQQKQEQIAAAWVAAVNQFIQWAGYAGTLAACIVLIRFGQGVGVAVYGLGRAAENRAMVLSNLISMDPRTRTYPLIQYQGHGLITVTNPMTGQTMLMNTANQADRQLIAAFGMQNLAGMVAYEARHHQADPAGVALVGVNPAMAGADETRADGSRLQIGAALGMVQDLMTVDGGQDAK